MEDTLPSDAAIIHFTATSPFFLLSMSFGIFYDPSTSMTFTSIDAYIGFYMLAQKEHRREIVNSPNGYIANRNLIGIITRSEGNQVIVPNWEQNCEKIMRHGLMLKYEQSITLYNVLKSTKNRPIYDCSRRDDVVWCWARGSGKNLHGKLLQEVREALQ